VEGTCECCNEPSGSIKCGEFLEKTKTGCCCSSFSGRAPAADALDMYRSLVGLL
jgi:hypothetical protein